MAVLEVIEREHLQKNAWIVGNYLMQKLRDLRYSIGNKIPIMGDIRGLGLYIGIEFVLDEDTLEPAAEYVNKICEKLKEMKILTGVDGPHNNVLRIKPPMCFSREDCDYLVDSLAKILKDIE